MNIFVICACGGRLSPFFSLKLKTLVWMEQGTHQCYIAMPERLERVSFLFIKPSQMCFKAAHSVFKSP